MPLSAFFLFFAAFGSFTANGVGRASLFASLFLARSLGLETHLEMKRMSTKWRGGLRRSRGKSLVSSCVLSKDEVLSREAEDLDEVARCDPNIVASFCLKVWLYICNNDAKFVDNFL